jgi:hypothetical protein
MADTIKKARAEKAYMRNFVIASSKHSVSCDLCGSNTGKIRENLNFFSLCPECSGRFEGLPLNLRNSMERFLIGNVY